MAFSIEPRGEFVYEADTVGKQKAGRQVNSNRTWISAQTRELTGGLKQVVALGYTSQNASEN